MNIIRKFGDNTVQGYGQKICLKSVILDFSGKKNGAFLSNYKSYPLYNISPGNFMYEPVFKSLKWDSKDPSYL